MHQKATSLELGQGELRAANPVNIIPRETADTVTIKKINRIRS
ncbi:hypothetical protein AB6A40_009944, partial [Gnathostoma spinigerum]